MKCEVRSRKTHSVLISKEISWKSYKEICRGEPRQANVGFNYSWLAKNGSYILIPRRDIQHFSCTERSYVLKAPLVMLRQQSYAIKNQLFASKAPYLGL